MPTVDKTCLDTLFFNARTHSAWTNQPVEDSKLRELFDILKWGPTSANCSPLRVVFVKSAEAKAKLVPCMAPGNKDKTQAAPVTAILGMDMEFYEKLPKLFPHADARSWFKGNEQLIKDSAFRNSSLQGAYFIIAARAVGLDCGPMSGFDNAAVDKAFFAGTPIKSNFVCNLGHGDPGKLFPRSPRFDFSEACSIV